jgi:hypothetical protein
VTQIAEEVKGFEASAQHEAVVAGKLARVIARPQDQVIRLRDDHQFFVPFQIGHVRLLLSIQLYQSAFSKATCFAGKGKAVKPLRRKSPRRTKSDVEVPDRRHNDVTVGRTHVRRSNDERAATQHTAILVINT